MSEKGGLRGTAARPVKNSIYYIRFGLFLFSALTVRGDKESSSSERRQIRNEHYAQIRLRERAFLISALAFRGERDLRNQIPDKRRGKSIGIAAPFLSRQQEKGLQTVTKENDALLLRLDAERQNIIYPGVTRIQNEVVVKDVSANGKNAEIVYSHGSEDTVDRCIQEQMESARQNGQVLEWKVYGHDRPLCLGNRLTAAGFEAGEKEAFMVFNVNESPAPPPRFGAPVGEIRRVTDTRGLRDYQTIREEIKNEPCDEEMARYAFLLENHPSTLSIYVAYVDNEPAACGRVYFHPDSAFAGLYGGQTRPQWRKRGLFTQLVAARIHEAAARGISYVCVDALPTSEPILQKRGFRALTFTQPFIYNG